MSLGEIWNLVRKKKTSFFEHAHGVGESSGGFIVLVRAYAPQALIRALFG
jgi:hypothetical protein